MISKYQDLHAVSRKMLTLLEDAAGMLAMPDPDLVDELAVFRGRLADLAPTDDDNAPLSWATVRAAADAYVAERDSLEQDDMPTFTRDAVPAFLARLEQVAPDIAAAADDEAVTAAVAAEQDRIIDAFLKTCVCGYNYDPYTGEPMQAQDCPTHGEPSARYYAKFYSHLIDPDRARARIAADEAGADYPATGFIPDKVDVPF